MDAEELRRVAAAARSASDSRAAAARARQDREAAEAVEQKKPEMRRAMWDSINKDLPDTAGHGGDVTTIRIGIFPEREQRDIDAALQVAQEAVKELGKSGIRGEAYTLDTKQLTTSQGGMQGGLQFVNSAPAKIVEIYLDWSQDQK